jgi:hypothetical protein
MQTSVSSHTDYSTFRNINKYSVNLAIFAPDVFFKHFQKNIAHKNFSIKLFVKMSYKLLATT